MGNYSFRQHSRSAAGLDDFRSLFSLFPQIADFQKEQFYENSVIGGKLFFLL